MRRTKRLVNHDTPASKRARKQLVLPRCALCGEPLETTWTNGAFPMPEYKCGCTTKKDKGARG